MVVVGSVNDAPLLLRVWPRFADLMDLASSDTEAASEALAAQAQLDQLLRSQRHAVPIGAMMVAEFVSVSETDADVAVWLLPLEIMEAFASGQVPDLDAVSVKHGPRNPDNDIVYSRSFVDVDGDLIEFSANKVIEE